MFLPPFCPYEACEAHDHPELCSPEPFFIHYGSYWPRCRAQPVPRFRCKSCHRTFSRQTFRMDYRDHRPHLNVELLRLLFSGLGLRQSARLLAISRRCVELKARKISRHLGLLHQNLSGPFPAGSWFQLDEMETFECERGVRPLTLPVLIEASSMFVAFARSAPIRPSGRMSPEREAAISRYEAHSGRRKDLSRRCLRQAFRWLRKHADELEQVLLRTDEKPLYRVLAREAFGDRLLHQQFSSRLPRDSENPIFLINLTNAMARDLNGRLRRRSWLVSKRGEYLDLQLALFIAYRNYVRPRFNRDTQTPAQLLGFVPRPLRPQELLTWRQDWSQRSIHPIARASESVQVFKTRPVAA